MLFQQVQSLKSESRDLPRGSNTLWRTQHRGRPSRGQGRQRYEVYGVHTLSHTTPMLSHARFATDLVHFLRLDKIWQASIRRKSKTEGKCPPQAEDTGKTPETKPMRDCITDGRGVTRTSRVKLGRLSQERSLP